MRSDVHFLAPRAPLQRTADGIAPYRPASALDRLSQQLIASGVGPITRDDKSLTIAPASPNGFPVTIFQTEEGAMVSFGQCEQEIESLPLACEWVVKALTAQCRLKVDYRGERACSWTLQSCSEGMWTDVFASGHTTFFGWGLGGKPSSRYFSNAVPSVPASG